jgi:hypothetical protein
VDHFDPSFHSHHSQTKQPVGPAVAGKIERAVGANGDADRPSPTLAIRALNAGDEIIDA